MFPSIGRYVLAVLVPFVAGAPAVVPGEARNSELWGEEGELWEEDGRLPDFSFAGYRSGEEPIPSPPVAARVTDFGAVPDDGNDDTEAFLAALDATEEGAILIPEGRYILTDRVTIRRPGVVLRGEGPGRTVLHFPKGLEHIDPNPSRTTGGQPVSNYSWSDGFLGIRGSINSESLAGIAAPAERGSRSITVEDPERLAEGMDVLIELRDDEEKSLVRYLYAGDSGNVSEIPAARYRPAQPARIAEIDGNEVLLDRALRYELRPEWQPTVRRFEATVSESGIESLTVEFPERHYEGHFTEKGYNALTLGGVRDCWFRDIEIVNSDSGLHGNSRYCTVKGITFRVTGGMEGTGGNHGHHGLSVGGTDNLVTDFDFQQRFIHDLTVSVLSAGNVFSNGRGVDICFDHHKRAPHANLYTNIDIGAGTRPWRSGGGADLGRHCAAWTTFWGIQAEQSFARQPGWSPDLVNFVGVPLTDSESLEPEGLWIENTDPSALRPANLHEAQLSKRLANGGKTPTAEE